MKVLLDTDIGNDLDDAVALGYLLNQPDCELLGVTTCTGDTQKRAALAASLCDAAGRGDIPIHAGHAGPYFAGPGQAQVLQYEALQGQPHRKNFPADGVFFLRETIRRHPGEVTLLAIGPLINLALLFKLDPEIPGLLGRLVLMNGTFTGFGDDGFGHSGRPGAREWNVKCDPHASAVVYAARCPGHLSVGLDVTHRCRMSADEVRQRFGEAAAPLPTIVEQSGPWFRRTPQLTLHDPLAAALLFAPQLCTYADGMVDVEVDSPKLAGLTAFQTNANETPHRISATVDQEAFFKHFFAVTAKR
jgi:purine nucleosidase